MKQKKLTRSQAEELYKDLRSTMKDMKSKGGAIPGKASTQKIAKDIAQAIKDGMKKDEANGVFDNESAMPGDSAMSFSAFPAPQRSGPLAALAFVLLCAFGKFAFTALEATGVLTVPTAHATMSMEMPRQMFKSGQYTRDEVQLLKSLDARRVELEERNDKLSARESDLDNRDREFAAKLTQIRELTDKLKAHRQKSEKKRSTQLEQLANVYGSMNPKEAAILIEQLDVTIALGLIERMPEKRIGQILSLMSPDRALTLTRMLSQ